jgi:uncharacterized membrane protein
MTALRWLLALVMVAAGANHFLSPATYVAMMPAALPWHLALVYISGVAEIAGGLGLLVPRTRRAAAWGRSRCSSPCSRPTSTWR